MNFVLGLTAEDPKDKFNVSIKMQNGRIVIEPRKPVYGGVRLTTTLYGAKDLSGELPEIMVFDGVEIEAEPFADSESGFYKVKVSISSMP